MSEKIKLKICLPSEVYLEKDVDKVQIPALGSDVTILSLRAPTVFVLKPGFIRVLDDDNKIKERYFVEGGVADYVEMLCKIMVENVTNYKDLDIKKFEDLRDNVATEKEKSYYQAIVDAINLEKLRNV